MSEVNGMIIGIIFRYDPTCRRLRLFTLTYANRRKQISIGLEPYIYKEGTSTFGNRSTTFLGFRITFKHSSSAFFV